MNDQRRWLAGRLEAAAFELRCQAARLYLGEPYQPRPVAERMAAVTEALELFDAAAEGEAKRAARHIREAS